MKQIDPPEVIAGRLPKYHLKDDRELRIAISGKSGWGITLINYTFRQLAEEKGLTLAQVIENAKTDDFYDKYVDQHQVELALKESCVLGSRLAIWMLKEADVKIYLLASDELRAQRILNREGGDFQKIKEFTAMRDAEDTKRYKKLYGIDNNDYSSTADLVIDSSINDPEQIVGKILTELEKRGFLKKA